MLPLLLTRPREAALSFASLCRARGFDGEIVVSPVMEIVPTAHRAEFSEYRTLIFTSFNAVSQLRGPLDGASAAYAVGDATADAVRARGLACTSAGGTVEDLMARLLDESPPGPRLHLRGTVSRGDLARRLTDAGLPTDERVIYDQKACALNGRALALLRGASPVIVPVFSPRTARLLGRALPPEPADLRLCMISEAAASAWDRGGTVLVAGRPDAASMADLALRMAIG